MRSILLSTLLLTLFISCKKEKTAEPSQTFTDKVVLNNLKATSDSVTLTWSTLNNPNFMYYRVTRKDNTSANGTTLTSINNANNTRYVDRAVPYTDYLEYQVTAYLTNGQVFFSNIVVYSRGEIKTINVKPFDVQFDSNNRTLYFFDKTGIISIYSLASNQITKTINSLATIGFSDFGTFNGVKELYVPRNDGWIFVYNATTLEKIDQISVGLEASCVVFNNGMLYVSSAAWTNRPLKVFSRSSKSLISETGDFELTRFKKIPGSNTELLEITINVGPVDQDYYSFGPGGNFISHSNDIYHGDYPLDYRIFEFFPAGNKYITSSKGAIYSKSMVYETSLPRGVLEFTTFDFDNSNQLIFAGTASKTVEVYSLTNYTHQRTITTKAYPYKLFKDGNKFICLSSPEVSSGYYNYSYPQKIIVEQIQ